MGTLYLVRHGQASFGADDYDVLSPLGQRQSIRLGEYFSAKDVQFEAALTGTLNRQVQTFAGICKGLGAPLSSVQWPGLNEYDAGAMIAASHPGRLEKPDTPELYKHHFRLLKAGLAQWIAGAASPAGMPSHIKFVADVNSALAHACRHYTGDVLLVSSGGPIAMAVGHLLGASAAATIDMNMGIRNTAVTEFGFNARGCRLLTYNTLPHLDAPEYASWVTYA